MICDTEKRTYVLIDVAVSGGRNVIKKSDTTENRGQLEPFQNL
jgi:hypothetical protein